MRTETAEAGMARFGRDDDVQGAEFVEVDLREARFRDVNLRGARFSDVDLSGAVIRGADILGAEIDSPWLFDGDAGLRVNGVNVAPYVNAELNKQFPGRELQLAQTPEELREAWDVLQGTWARLLERVAAMPDGTVDESVDGEWSFAQTLRHLVRATDVWLGRSVLELAQPFHPVGIGAASPDNVDPSIFRTDTPTYAEVLEARADRVALVRDFLAKVTPEDLDTVHKNPWNPDHPETTRECLRVILEEEWEHYRYATRDLAALEARSDT